MTGAEADRAVVRAHDIGLKIVEKDGKRGFEVIVGRGLGRTPMIGKTIREFLPEADLLPYLEAVLAVYNRLGRRDNKYKARIKITVHENGLDRIRSLTEEAFLARRGVFSAKTSPCTRTGNKGRQPRPALDGPPLWPIER